MCSWQKAENIILCKHRPFWQLNWFSNFAASQNENPVFHEKMSNLTKEKTGKFKAWSFAKKFLKLTEQTFAFTWKNTLFNLPKSENCFIEVLVYQSFKIKELDLSVNKQSLLPFWKIQLKIQNKLLQNGNS